jgi:quercetin dioxygenase-like cupin family protein
MKKDKKDPTVNTKRNSRTPMDKHIPVAELEKSKTHTIGEIIKYALDSIVTRCIIKKITGDVTISAIDEGQESAEKISPFDYFIQIIDGSVEVRIDGKPLKVRVGEGIIIPAHTFHSFIAIEQFKMISTVVKSGYES